PGSGYTPTSQLPPSQQQHQQSTQQTQGDLPSRSHRPGTDTYTPTPLSARGGPDLGSSGAADTPPTTTYARAQLNTSAPPLTTAEKHCYFPAHNGSSTGKIPPL
ncbi:hypothetical protein V491_05250, partial [Pseudogymnoascus sp. VKM F-3775]